MKTTVDLPNELVRAFKLLTVQRGRKLNATAVAILGKQLEETAPRAGRPLPKTLPLMPVRPLKTPAPKPMSAQAMSDFIKQADLNADTERYEKAFGH